MHYGVRSAPNNQLCTCVKAERWFHKVGLAIHTGVRRLGVSRSGDPPYSLSCNQSAIERRHEEDDDDDDDEEKDGYAQEESPVDP
jgi:hypothetical protein